MYSAIVFGKMFLFSSKFAAEREAAVYLRDLSWHDEATATEIKNLCSQEKYKDAIEIWNKSMQDNTCFSTFSYQVLICEEIVDQKIV